MEKRLLLFFAIVFLLVAAWPRLFPPPAKAPNAAENVIPPVESTAPPSESAEPRESVRTEPTPSREGGSMPLAASREETSVVDTDVYQLTFSNRGGRLTSARLKAYADAVGEPYELVSPEASQGKDVYPLSVHTPDGTATQEIAEGLYEVRPQGPIAVTGDETASLELVWANGSGLEVSKRLTFHGSDYGVDVEVSVREEGREVAKEIAFGPGLGREIASGQYVGSEKGVLAARNTVELFAARDLEEAGGQAVNVEATGVSSHYFAALMLPEPGGLYGSRLAAITVPASSAGETAGNGEARKEHKAITATLETPGTPARIHLFLGPKKLELLEELRPGLSRIIEFGWMRYPALLLRWGLLRIHEVIGNWGWSIMLLTLVINLFLVPLKHHSFVSMRKMQKLGPQMQRIRERYKKVKPTDPRYQQMNAEIMGLYKEHKVSPVSGCLPILLMIPFFFAFYKLLMASIELRHAPFLFWIQDLARYDPYYVLPILMGGTQIAIQRMTPQTTVDPVQAKMMQFMPILFTFILATAPAGLVLYWFSNNLVSLAQQAVTNRWLGSAEDGEGGATGAKAKKAAKQAQAHG
jgi:YidC/Oxa1 family membrane protein insertase